MKRRSHRVFTAHNGEGPWPCHGCDQPVTKLFVHHLDEDHDNDDPTNLVAMHQPCHNRLHHVGRRRPPETGRKIGEANRTREVTVETRRKIGASSRGRVLSAETRAKMSIAHTGKRRQKPLDKRDER